MWILWNLHGIQRLGLIFGQQDGLERNSWESTKDSCPLEGFIDANYTGDLDTRRYTIGYIFCINGGPVSWRSIFQLIITLSTIEAEYIGIIEATKKVLWLKRLIREMQ